MVLSLTLAQELLRRCRRESSGRTRCGSETPPKDQQMTSDPSNADVIDAVAMELSRFSRDVVPEVHRLRDELGIEKQRVTALEAEVAELRRTRTPSVAPDARTQPVAEPVAATVSRAGPSCIGPRPRTSIPPATSQKWSHLQRSSSRRSHCMRPDPVPTSAGLDNLARVLAELSEPIAVAWPTDS